MGKPVLSELCRGKIHAHTTPEAHGQPSGAFNQPLRQCGFGCVYDRVPALHATLGAGMCACVCARARLAKRKEPNSTVYVVDVPSRPVCDYDDAYHARQIN